MQRSYSGYRPSELPKSVSSYSTREYSLGLGFANSSGRLLHSSAFGYLHSGWHIYVNQARSALEVRLLTPSVGCIPISATWNLAENGRCVNTEVLYTTGSVTDVLGDGRFHHATVLTIHY